MVEGITMEVHSADRKGMQCVSMSFEKAENGRSACKWGDIEGEGV